MQNDWLHFAFSSYGHGSVSWRPETPYALGSKRWGFCAVSRTPPIPQTTQCNEYSNLLHISKKYAIMRTW